MAVEIVMPKLGLNMSEGTLIEWFVKEGDQINKGDLLFSVETEKVNADAEAQDDGILAKILVQAGDVVPVKAVVGYLVQPGESLEIAEEEISEAPEPVAQATPEVQPSNAADKPKRLIASPLAKRLAKENGIDIALVVPANADGKIRVEDVEQYLSGSTESAQGKENRIKIEGVRSKIAEKMQHSMQQTAQFTLHSEIDVTKMVQFREDSKSSASSAIGYNAILAKACSVALKEFPYMNARQDGEYLVQIPEIHIGLAVDTAEGLKVVVVRDVDKKDLVKIDAEFSALAKRAVDQKATLDDLSGSTFTLSNLGVYGIDRFTPILNSPEIALLGIGKIGENLTINDGKVAQRYVMALSLTIDHRLVDGAPAARFLQKVGSLLTEMDFV